MNFNEAKRGKGKELVLGKDNLTDNIHFTEHTGFCNL